MSIDKSLLGMVAEHYVAAELGRRGVFCQMTFGNQKRTDLLAFLDDNSRVLRIEVKGKQGSSWAPVKGISLPGSFIVFVDFHKKEVEEKPDFYILSVGEWAECIEQVASAYRKKHPNKRAEVVDNVLRLLDEVNKNKNNKIYEGHSVKLSEIGRYKDRWDSIIGALNQKEI